MIEISENEYALLMEYAKQHIRHQFDNSGSWIHRSKLIEDAAECGLGKDFISELSSDAEFEDKKEKKEAREANLEYQNTVL